MLDFWVMSFGAAQTDGNWKLMYKMVSLQLSLDNKSVSYH